MFAPSHFQDENMAPQSPAEDAPAIAVRHQPLAPTTKTNMSSPVTARDFQKHPLALAHLHSPKQTNIDALLGNGSLPSSLEDLPGAGDENMPTTPTRTSKSSTPIKSAAYNSIRSSLLGKPDNDNADRLAMTLFNGGHFIKFGRRGKPRPKFVVCSQDGILFWSDLTGGKTLTSVKLVQVTKVHTGKATEVFKRNIANDVPDEVCLSVVTKDRSLDLQAESEEQRDLWVKALRLAVDNVQTVGKVTQQPVSSTDVERKERSYDKRISQLQKDLEATKKVIFQKNQEIILREQKLVLERRNSQTELAKRDSMLEEKLSELEQLKQQQSELNRKIKIVHHERSASRQVHTGAYRDLELKLQRLETEKAELEEKHKTEKDELAGIISDSKKLLAKAKDTIHKRQMSRAQRLAHAEAMEEELKELRIRNMELRTEVSVAKAAQEKAERELEKARKVIALGKLDLVDLDQELARVESAQSGDAPAMNSSAASDEEDAAPTVVRGSAPELMATIQEEEVPVPVSVVTQSSGEPAASAVAASPSPRPMVLGTNGVEINFDQLVPELMWQPDEAADNCPKCHDKFGVFTRKHHCRKCGSLACNDCSKTKANVRQTGDKVRVCVECVKDLLVQ